MTPRSLRLVALVTLAGAAVVGGCKRGRDPKRDLPTEPTTTAATATGSATALASTASAASLPAPADGGAPRGISVETAGTITLVRIDPARYALRLQNARKDGHARRAPEWAKEFGLVAVVNASMYQPSGDSVGLMINGAHVNQGHDLPKMGGYFAFAPTRSGVPPVAAFGRDCPGFDLARIRADYGVVFQNYRLLDCEGRPLAWKEARSFSAAAIGLDRDGLVVFAHSRAPYAMTDFAKLIAAPELRIAQMFYVEGGPEASLYVQAGSTSVRAIGDYETGFFRRDSNDEFWELPNVVGVAPR
jgi:uncharacterized protein YigE (DUF2233 family)